LTPALEQEWSVDNFTHGFRFRSSSPEEQRQLRLWVEAQVVARTGSERDLNNEAVDMLGKKGDTVREFTQPENMPARMENVGKRPQVI
jgi:hypothetical protein